MINVTRDAMSTRAGTGAARPAWESGMSGFFAAHRAMLDRAVETIHSRGYWSAFPEAPSGRIYGETAKADAEAAFKALLGKPFELDQPDDAGLVGEVLPGAERPAGAGEHERARARVVHRFLECRPQGCVHRLVEAVELVGPVEGDDPIAGPHLDADRGLAHARLPRILVFA